MNETRTLARFVAETRFTDLPRRLVENLTITVLDTLGAALVGARQPWAQRIVAVIVRFSTSRLGRSVNRVSATKRASVRVSFMGSSTGRMMLSCVLDLEAHLGRRGPGPATACGAHSQNHPRARATRKTESERAP